MNLYDLKHKKMLVIGDIMVDDFIFGTAAPEYRLSPEAPVPVVRTCSSVQKLGGACNVASNLRSLGCSVDICGLVGEDKEGKLCVHMLEDMSISTSRLVYCQNPTIVKTRVICDNQHVVRLDREEEFSKKYSSDLVNKLTNNTNYDAVIVSDYSKGTITNNLMDFIKDHFREIMVLVDPKPDSGDKIDLYRGVTAVTPNLREARMLVKNENISPEMAARQLLKLLDCEFVVITLSEKGLLVACGDEITHIPAYLVPLDHERPQKRDVTGAGDTIISTLSAFLSLGFSRCRSLAMANIAAAIVVNKMGTATCTLSELQEEIEHAEKMAANFCGTD